MQDEEKEKLFLYVLVGETCQKESRERGKEGGEKKGKFIVTTAWVNYMSLPQFRKRESLFFSCCLCCLLPSLPLSFLFSLVGGSGTFLLLHCTSLLLHCTPLLLHC
jgi:hypothetical protein